MNYPGKVRTVTFSSGVTGVPYCHGYQDDRQSMDEAVCDLLARRAEVHHGGDRFLADRFPDDGMPLLPLALVVRLVAGVEQQPPAEGAPAVLAAQQVPGRGTDRGRLRSRRLAQYPARSGSSGDALPATITCMKSQGIPHASKSSCP